MADTEIFSSFYGAGFGAIVGALLAFFSTLYTLQSERKKKLEKIHQIINDEFYRIYVYTNDAKEYITKQLESEKKLEAHFYSVEHEVVRGRSPIIFNLPNFRFLLWDSIISSGSLINLESDEIQLVNSTHDNMNWHFKNLEKYAEDFYDTFSILDNKGELKKKTPRITKIDLQMFLTHVYSELVIMQEDFDTLSKNISWIKKEYSNQNMFNKEAFYDIPQDVLINVPFPKEEEPERKTPI